MTSLLSDIGNGVEGAVDKVLGPGYDYAAAIPSMQSLGVSSDGSMDTTLGDIQALGTYAGYLVTGPNLGNKFFMNTGASCTAPGGSIVDRWRYMDNSNDQPKFSRKMGSLASFANGELQGLIPGLLAAVEDLSPMGLISSLTRPAYGPCQKVTCPVGDVTGTMSTETEYVLQDDVSDLTANYGCSVVEGFAGRRGSKPDKVLAACLIGFLLVCTMTLREFRK